MKYEYNIKVISDIHVGCKDDMRLIDKELPLFTEAVKNTDTDGIVITGDLFHRILKGNEYGMKGIIDWVNTINRVSLEKKIPFRLIKGTKTHDFNQLSIFKYLEGTNVNFRIIDNMEEEYLLPGLKVLYIPEEYVGEDYYKNIWNQNYDVIFGHGCIDFAGYNNDASNNEKSINSAPTFKVAELSKISRVILFGHIHNSCNSNNAYYVGSYSRNSFAEFPSRYYVNLLITQDKYEVNYIENKEAPKYINLNLDELEFEEIEQKMQFVQDIKESYDYVKITTRKTDNKDEITLMKTILKGTGVNIEVKNKVETKKTDEKYLFVMDKSIPIEERIQKFIKLKWEKDVPLEIIKRNIEN